jgi:hypothetical protein
MFLPIFYFCLATLNPAVPSCGFIHGAVVSSPEMCFVALKQQHKNFEENRDKVLHWTGTCLKLEKATEV